MSKIKNERERIIRIPRWASHSVWSIYSRRHVFLCTYLCNSLQAHVVALVLPFLQFLQGYPHLSDEFIPSQSVHIAHTQPSHTYAHARTHTKDQNKPSLIKPGLDNNSFQQHPALTRTINQILQQHRISRFSKVPHKQSHESQWSCRTFSKIGFL